jgi:hypothetical protein
MNRTNKSFLEKLHIPPHDWLSWSDDYFNEWRRKHDFPRILDFLFESLPYFSLWLSEQHGLTEQDLIFHGPARFIRFYGEPISLIEYNEFLSLNKREPEKIKLRPYFLKKIDSHLNKNKIIRRVQFSSYIDWAFKNKHWIFPRKINDLTELVQFLTPTGITYHDSSYLNSNSSIQLNIPLFMPSISLDELFSPSRIKSPPPPRLELLKLGGGCVEITDGLIGQKNLEFVNIDNLNLTSPLITSHQNFTYSTLRNLNITGQIHAATFHQCATELNIDNGGLIECNFEYGNSKIALTNSSLHKSLIRERRLDLKLQSTEVTQCCFKYLTIFSGSPTESQAFNQSAKMIFSHLGYPDLAGDHFYLEQQQKRKGLWQMFSSLKRKTGLLKRLSSLLNYIWMGFKGLYWGYGEKPFNIIFFSLFIILAFSLTGYLSQSSSTYLDLVNSLTFSFQSFTNISIKEIKQDHDLISLTASLMSFTGLISVGLLIASLSAKSKNYN